MNVYDFDKTIYAGDSTIDFYLFCLKRQPAILRSLPMQIKGLIQYKQKRIDKTAMKEQFYSFLKGLHNVEQLLCEFWDLHEGKMQAWYIEQQAEDDVVISASPAFLLEEICDRKKIRYLIASEVDMHTGICFGQNCRGEEKVKRFYERFGTGVTVDRFYSDSRSDQPMAELASQAYLVKGNKIKEWE